MAEFSRRIVLAGVGGALVAAGAVSSLGSRAFLSTLASRRTGVNASDDGNAFVGLSFDTVDAGETNDLVAVTNNTVESLTVSVTLVDPAKGSVSPQSTAIAPGDTFTFAVDVSADAPGGENALAFDVDATGSESTTVGLRRRVGVRNFQRKLEDRTRNTNALYYLSYRVFNVDTFQRFEVTVRNLGPSRDDLPTRTYSSTDEEGIFRVPESGTDGGAEGDDYEFTMDVYDANGVALQRTVTDTADGQNPPDNDDIGGGPSDPTVESVTVTDGSDLQTDQTQFVVEYEIANLDRFQEARVTFDNASNDWSDETVTSTDAPTGTVQYPSGGGTQGGTSGDEYEITVEAVNENGIVVDSRTESDIADGSDP